jgi:peptidyl-prolyl cis-trans isomerase A (cyclophilin A)
MRRSLLVVLAVLIGGPLLVAQPPDKLPVVVCNFQKVMFDSVPGKAVLEEFTTYSKKMQDIINQKETEAEKLRSELKEKDKTLKQDEKDKLTKQIATLDDEAKRTQAEAEAFLQKREADVIPQLEKEIDRLLKEYGKERGIGLVVDQSPRRSQGGQLIPPATTIKVINPAFDITDELIKRLATFKVAPPVEEKIDPKDNDPKPQVILQTSAGDIVIELDRAKAPITVANFLKYVDNKHYEGTVFHRVLKEFVIQGGGHTATLDEKPTGAPIKNEASNGLSNVRGTIAMAREEEPDTATSQFYINVVDNSKKLDFAGPMKPGYCVFGKVVKGMDVVDKIREGKTGVLKGMKDVPVDLTTVKSAVRVPKEKS